jgi:hypothetical protein
VEEAIGASLGKSAAQVAEESGGAGKVRKGSRITQKAVQRGLARDLAPGSK